MSELPRVHDKVRYLDTDTQTWKVGVVLEDDAALTYRFLVSDPDAPNEPWAMAAHEVELVERFQPMEQPND